MLSASLCLVRPPCSIYTEQKRGRESISPTLYLLRAPLPACHADAGSVAGAGRFEQPADVRFLRHWIVALGKVLTPGTLAWPSCKPQAPSPKPTHHLTQPCVVSKQAPGRVSRLIAPHWPEGRASRYPHELPI